MRRGPTILFLIGLFFVCVISGVVYFLSIQDVRIPAEEHTAMVSEPLPKGVSVVEKDGSRILTDNRAGYEMVIPDDIDLKTEEDRILFYSREPHLPVLGGIHIFENTEGLSLEEWVENEHKKSFFLFYDERQKSNIGGIELIKIQVEGEMEYYSYFFKKDGKIVGISLVGQNYSDKYIESIKIIK
ncbi:MAG TPA: hypothetical protein PK295_04425 [Candidatus Magasanikbacteria bacterium]|nr:hypothetical protein [Candidatus Magasanikbacteria bacterium]